MRSPVLAIVLCAAIGCSKPSSSPTPSSPAPADEPPAVLPVAHKAEGKLDSPMVPRAGRSVSKASVADLRKTADDPRADRADRAAAVFAPFANHLRPPTGRVATGQVFGEAGWLKAAHLHALIGLGGWIPVKWEVDETVYCLRLFPYLDGDRMGWSDWVIYLRVSGGPHRSSDEARAFLRGEKGVTGTPELIEFALCYPDEMNLDGIENFGPKGMTVLPTG